MKVLLIVIIAFLVLIYVNAYIRYKKMKKNGVDTVGQYREKYQEKKRLKDVMTKENPQIHGYRPYVTKYNSNVDYIDKDEFFKEASGEKPKTKRREL